MIEIYGFCESDSKTVATAVLNGDIINYNECSSAVDDPGEPDQAFISGVLMHEITHNIGYDHEKVNPDPNSVPYFMGDFVEEYLSPNSSSEHHLPSSKRSPRKTTSSGANSVCAVWNARCICHSRRSLSQ